MRFLVDTHVFLWFVDGDPRLPVHVVQAIEDSGNEKVLSIGSLWEIAIKVNKGRLKLSRPLLAFLATELKGFESCRCPCNT